MDLSSLATLGKVAGLGGIAIGVVALLVRPANRSGVFGSGGATRAATPPRRHGCLRHWCAWDRCVAHQAGPTALPQRL
jgi:hypothetical protein